tara:strand:- start:256 stop:525 length:270 start_codon:yes stop_codon:yes gene_type:complete
MTNKKWESFISYLKKSNNLKKKEIYIKKAFLDHNMDLKSFLLDFFMYIIHSNKYTLSKNELKGIEFICHTDTKEEILLNYIISFINNKI